MRMTASWSGPHGPTEYKVVARCSVPDGKLPSDRRPDRVKRDVVLRAVKVWPGQGGACGKIGAKANLDGSCARRGEQRARRPSPSSPAPSRYAALGLDRSARPSKGDTMPQMRAGRCSPVLKIHARHTTSDRSSAGFLTPPGWDWGKSGGPTSRKKLFLGETARCR